MARHVDETKKKVLPFKVGLVHLDVYINHTWYDSFFCGNCIGFYTEENARRYIKLYDEHCELVKKIYDEHCKLVEKTSNIKPQYIYPDAEHDGKRTDED